MKRSNSIFIRRRFTAAERAAWVRRFQRSGLTQRDFATQHGLGLSTLGRWLGQPSNSVSAPAFAEVKLPVPGGRWAAEIVHADGVVLRLAHDVPVHLVEQLLPAC